MEHNLSYLAKKIFVIKDFKLTINIADMFSNTAF
jgi:hypothetical protein